MPDKSKEEELAEQVMAVLTNRCVVQMDSCVTRITFLEAFGDNVEVRTAICMSTAGAVEFYRMLGGLIAKLPSGQGKAH